MRKILISLSAFSVLFLSYTTMSVAFMGLNGEASNAANGISTMSGAQKMIQEGQALERLGAGAAEHNESPSAYATQQSEEKAINQLKKQDALFR